MKVEEKKERLPLKWKTAIELYAQEEQEWNAAATQDGGAISIDVFMEKAQTEFGTLAEQKQKAFECKSQGAPISATHALRCAKLVAANVGALLEVACDIKRAIATMDRSLRTGYLYASDAMLQHGLQHQENATTSRLRSGTPNTPMINWSLTRTGTLIGNKRAVWTTRSASGRKSCALPRRRSRLSGATLSGPL